VNVGKGIQNGMAGDQKVCYPSIIAPVFNFVGAVLITLSTDLLAKDLKRADVLFNSGGSPLSLVRHQGWYC
jgi:hypothetical protein